jgi:hypothetical protein
MRKGTAVLITDKTTVASGDEVTEVKITIRDPDGDIVVSDQDMAMNEETGKWEYIYQSTVASKGGTYSYETMPTAGDYTGQDEGFFSLD